MYYVIIDLQDIIGFSIVEDTNNPERIVFSGTEKECHDFYAERYTEWVESLESQLLS